MTRSLKLTTLSTIEIPFPLKDNSGFTRILLFFKKSEILSDLIDPV